MSENLKVESLFRGSLHVFLTIKKTQHSSAVLGIYSFGPACFLSQKNRQDWYYLFNVLPIRLLFIRFHRFLKFLKEEVCFVLGEFVLNIFRKRG
jgi:hypothetical protein